MPDEIVTISRESEGGYDHFSVPIGCKIEINDVSRSEEVGIFPIGVFNLSRRFQTIVSLLQIIYKIRSKINN